jgi:hypothetical protein
LWNAPFVLGGGDSQRLRNHLGFVLGSERLAPQKTKKADVAEHPKAFGHVGLLFNEPLGRTELLFA